MQATKKASIPAHKAGTDPVTGADRFINDVTPQTTFGPSETNQFAAAFVSAMPLQMAYAASFDLDLAPYNTPASARRRII